MTTSSYTAGALEEEAEEPGTPVVLIDAKLVELLLEARLGVTSVVEHARIDEDVFAAFDS